MHVTIRPIIGAVFRRMATPATAQSQPGRLGPMPRSIFVVEMSYLVLLIALFFAYVVSDGLRDALPSLGPIPIQVAWFGAIGGVLAGLGGVYYHNQEWDPAYDFWHYSRPFVGAVVGGIGSLLFYVSISVGTKNAIEPNALTFDAVAFILGFADDAFRDLIKKVTTLLFGAGGEPPPPQGALTPAPIVPPPAPQPAQGGVTPPAISPGGSSGLGPGAP
jgi:hypothetical protein